MSLAFYAADAMKDNKGDVILKSNIVKFFNKCWSKENKRMKVFNIIEEPEEIKDHLAYYKKYYNNMDVWVVSDTNRTIRSVFFIKKLGNLTENIQTPQDKKVWDCVHELKFLGTNRTDTHIKTAPWIPAVNDVIRTYKTLVVELVRYDEGTKEEDEKLNTHEKLFTWYSILGFKSMTKAILHDGKVKTRTVDPYIQLKFQNTKTNPYAEFNKKWEVSKVGPLIRMVYNKSFLW